MEAVVSVSQGALGPLLGKLNTLLADECTRLTGVRREIRLLRSELSNMHTVLQKYAMLEEPDVQVKAWTGEVRELAYDIEDCIDKFLHHVGGDEHGSAGGIKEYIRKRARQLKTLGCRRQIVGQIEELKARVVAVKEHKTSYKLDEVACGSASHAAVDPRLSALFAEEHQLVGIEGPRDDLMNWLLEGERASRKHRKVLSIVGFGGLGKTTLANEVYRHLKGQFQCAAFVSLSQKPNMEKILKDVIFQLHGEKDEFSNIETWDEKRLITKSRELLQDKRYLVVIDDVWSISTWRTIKCAFSKDGNQSIIITTTRIIDVAMSCCSCGDDRIYKMEPLNKLYSKRLFFGRIFGSEDQCPCHLQEISHEILKKCGGLPLAISSISSLLANKLPLKEEWEKVSKSIGMAMKHQSLEGMKVILSLSYNDLPHHLKTCLLYLSIFPEDYDIDRDRLVWRWIVEGFISKERGLSMKEVAETYFYELINKSMVQPVGIDYDGKARACRVHDIMLELIISKTTEENFVTVLGNQNVVANQQFNIRRLSTHYIDQKLTTMLASTDLCHVRSLTSFFIDMKCFPRLAEFEALRVLDLEDCKGLEEYDMSNIDKFFQLKYLNLKHTSISKISSKIVKLQDLEILDLRYTYIQELPIRIVWLTKLVYLLVGSILSNYMKLPDGIGNMGNLQWLSGFDICKNSTNAVEELGKLTKLKKLEICFESGQSNIKRYEEMLLASLCKLGSYKLQSLHIYSDDSCSREFLDGWSPPPNYLQSFTMHINYYFPKIPQWMVSLGNIACLDINLSELTEEDLCLLGNLPALLSLGLLLKSDSKERLTIRGITFLSLKVFILICNYCSDGAYITFEKGAMPKLERLGLPFNVTVAKTNGFYLGIKHLPCLKEANIRLYTEGAKYSETKVAEAAIREEANVHPNHPRVTIKSY